MGPGLLEAQDVPRSHLYDRFQATASGTLLVLGTKIRIDPDTGEGTEIDLEDNLAIGSTTLQPRLALRWRPGRRHELEGRHRPHRQDQLRGQRLAVRRGLRVLSQGHRTASITGASIWSLDFGVAYLK